MGLSDNRLDGNFSRLTMASLTRAIKALRNKPIYLTKACGPFHPNHVLEMIRKNLKCPDCGRKANQHD